ncbi:hypothetical protein EPD60_07640 [Flaviaesturariibacter flavus]|uniref:Tetratricopeptide repeat protein n=1 Tax=Flaviaesturariibacter flavus TaxID=2502780 RepID=A0A4R1BFZ6_9BACT|nr:hypothetical protein [Flaviaesturariibacter flavus]TCJ16099.1 hypothetical protein EPD60_07640 [Flaviaesturariibacter flavus]
MQLGLDFIRNNLARQAEMSVSEQAVFFVSTASVILANSVEDKQLIAAVFDGIDSLRYTIASDKATESILAPLDIALTYQSLALARLADDRDRTLSALRSVINYEPNPELRSVYVSELERLAGEDS